MFYCQELKQKSEQALNRAPCDPRKPLWIHVGAITAASLLLTLINYVLQLQIDTTGGLSGIGTRSILSTVLTVLQMLYFVLMPFWQAGYLRVSLAIAREQRTNTEDLFSGFHRFGPFLRLYLLQGLLFGALLIASNYASSFLYMLTPWGRELMAQLTVLLEQSGANLSEDALASLASHAIPMLILGGVIFLVAALPVFYRMRLSRYLVMEGQSRALRAILESFQLTKGCWGCLFKLDLSFWWFYAAQILIGLLGYGDILLELAGYPLPWGEALRFFLPYVAYLALHFGFQIWQKNRVDVTYAYAYEALRQPDEPNPQPNTPSWDNNLS